MEREDKNSGKDRNYKLASAKKILNKLLIVKTADRNIFQIIIWWEIRRVLYNLIVLIAGLTSLLISEFCYLHIRKETLQPAEDFVEPIVILLFAFLCNVFYSFGWITEIFVKKSTTYAPKMFKFGLLFTLFWTLLPAIIHSIWAIIYFVRQLN